MVSMIPFAIVSILLLHSNLVTCQKQFIQNQFKQEPAVTTTTTTATTKNEILFDKKIVIKNKGLFAITMDLTYYNPTKTVQSNYILSFRDFAFCK